MRVVKFSLLTVFLLYLGMLYFGREAGLPNDRIGRDRSLWAELFGEGDDAGPLALLTQPATGPVPEANDPLRPAPQGAADPGPSAQPAPRTALAARSDAPPDTPAEAPVVADDPATAEAEPLPTPEDGAAQDPEATQIAGSENAPERSRRPAPRPDLAVAIAEANPTPEQETALDPAPEPTDTVEAAVETVLAEALDGALDDPTPDVLVAVAPEAASAAEPGAAGAVEPETPIAAAPDLVTASVFAPDITPRPARKPEPPVAPAVLNEPDSFDTAAPAPETLVVAQPPPAATVPELDAVPDPASTVADTVQTVTAAAEAALQGDLNADTAAMTEPAENALADIGPVVDLTSDTRPLQTPDAVPSTALAAVPEPADSGGVIVAPPLAESAPDPEPAPVVPMLPDEPQGVLYVSATDGLVVRAAPTAGDRAIDELPRGSAVVDLGGDGDGWRMILLPNGAAGYIPDTEVSLTPGQ